MMSSRTFKRSTARGFSLIELLVVMFIIGLVVAITIPALGFARTLAKKTSTQSFMTGLSQACTVFQNDNRRVPGYFSPRDMGSAENVANGATGGFTAMDNVLLDLSGGVVTASGASTFLAGPTLAGKVNVDPDRVGVATGSGKVYWAPDAKYYETQVAAGKSGDPLNLRLKSVVDAFGQPLLFWANDDAAIAPLTAINPEKFASEHAGLSTAKFYWAGNSAYLGAANLGKRARDQRNLSMLGSTQTPANKTKFMQAFLGNPSAVANPADPQNSWVPSAGRGKFMIHSAGADAVFVSTEDSGYKKHGGNSLSFASNFVAGSTKPTDIASDFDDLLVSGGN